MTVLLFGLNFLDIVHFRLGFMRALARAGHRVVALAPPDEGQAELEREGFTCIPLAMERTGRNPLREVFVFRDVLRAYRAVRPDIAFHYSIKPNIYGVAAARLCGIPCVNVVAGLGYVFIHDTLSARLGRFMWRLAFRFATRIVTLNADDARLLVERRYVPASRLELISGEGVDCEAFAPGAVRVPPRTGGEPFVFLYVGRILRDKGMRELVDAALLLRAEGAHAVVRLLGGIDTQNPSRIPEEEVRGWERDGAVEYLGVASDVRPHLAAADCMVLPSYREGLSHSLAEGAAMERPIIATDVPGCRDLVEDGRSGFLVPARDTAALAGAMRRMMALDADARRAMGARGRERMLEEFSDPRISARLFEIIDRVLAEHRAQG